jgi:fimbrial isopeptide formation D2 family protein/LPXTG-motif cell wall-anchored protein
MKKILALVLALAMVALCAVASAATITISRDSTYVADDDNQIRTLKYFKVFDATKDGTAISYTLDGESPWVAVLTATGENAQTYFTLTPNASNSLYYVTAHDITDANAADAAAWLLAHKPSSVAETALTYNESTHKWTATVDDIGYYVIVSYDMEDQTLTQSSKLIAWTTDIDIAEKNHYPTVDKKQKEAVGDSYVDDNVQVKVGDTIYYSVDVTVPADASLPIHVVDTMTNGLTYDTGSMTIKVGDAEPATTHTDVTVATVPSGATWAYDIEPTANTKGTHVIFYFTATVNADAIVDTGKENEVDIQYGNTDYHKTDDVDYEIFATGALKYDGATGVVDSSTNELSAAEGKTLKPLDGAKFKLQVQASDGSQTWTDQAVAYNSTDNYYYPTTGTGVDITTPANGKIFIRGLDNDHNYRLVETQAPEGYNLMNPAETGIMTLVADTYTGTPATLSSVSDPILLKVANNQGSELPSTGGIGTTIFYIVGGILLIGAAVILVARRKAHD